MSKAVGVGTGGGVAAVGAVGTLGTAAAGVGLLSCLLFFCFVFGLRALVCTTYLYK